MACEDALAGVHVYGERCLRHEVEAAAIAPLRAPAQVLTVSLGVATRVLDAHDTVDALIEEADWRLYEAKALGRNRVSG